MKIRTLCSGSMAALFVVAAWTGPAVAKTIKVPRDQPTISAAITAAAPGDKVKVEKGVYKEQVIIDKAITVEGSGAKDTIIDGQNVITLPYVGQVRIVASGDVKFSKFTIMNAGRPGNYPATRVGIYAQSLVPGVTYSINQNRIIGSNDGTDDEDYGFYSNSGKESLVFTDNEISETGANPILLELHSGPTDVSHNTFDVGIGPSDGYFNMNYGGTDITTPQKVSHNTVDASTGDPSYRATGITVVAGFTGAKGGFTNVQIDHNEISLGSDTVNRNRRGIGTWNNATTPTDNNIVAVITHNEVTGTGGQYGIGTIGYITDTHITHNHLEEMVTGIKLRTWSNANAVDLDISRNHVDASGNYAIILEADSLTNVVKDNHLEAATLTGDASVQDLGAGNIVMQNK